MATEDQMSVNERRKYVKLMKARYVAAKREERGRLLSEMEQVTGLHRKSLTRLMQEPRLERKKRATPLWVGDRADHRAGVGESGLHLCGAPDAGACSDGTASGAL